LNKIYENIIPQVENWPITTFYKHRKEFIKELNKFVFDKLSHNRRSKEELIAKSLYLENLRATNTPWKVDPADDKTYWRDLTRELENAMKRSDKQEEVDKILMRLINRFNEEIVGDFNPSTFKFARNFLTKFFKLFFNRFNEGKAGGYFWGNADTLHNRLVVTGEIEKTRNLFNKGTVVLVPTHFSNLDSIMIGYVIDLVGGLPAFAYGAGLNLLDVEIVAHYISKLGAYKVDRRKKNPIYLECLTSMASYSLYKGLNNIFFPGGTRSRSGAIEDKLKLGLLGSAIEGQRLLIEANKSEKVIIVPVVVGYNFVLEAKSLVDQYLRSIAPERYVKSKDTLITFGDRINFIKKLFQRKSSMYLSFGEPMDVMGNYLDENCVSRDKLGNEINLKDYFKLGDDLSENSQRESVYTKLLSQKVLESYMRNNIVTTSHFVTFLAFKIMTKFRKDLDLIGILKLHPSEMKIPLDVFEEVAESARSLLLKKAKLKQIKVEEVFNNNISEIIDEGLRTGGIYHGRDVIYKSDMYLKTTSLKLLYFYHNRLIGYEIENEIDWSPVKEINYLEQIKEHI
jgi:glycerol-3-phosphate O-acyltransferase